MITLGFVVNLWIISLSKRRGMYMCLVYCTQIHLSIHANSPVMICEFTRNSKFISFSLSFSI